MKKLNYLTVDWPLDYSKLFAEQQPVIVEIGFGNADYLIHLAETNPDHNIIGLEISSQSMDKAERKIQTQGLTNVRPIHSTAETALAHLFEPQTIQAFHINYPDPWFKKKHSRRRLIKRETVDMITSRLAPNGQLLLATDIIEYAEMSHEVLSETMGLTNTFNTPWVDDLEGRFRTKYEMKGYREGRSGHFFIYQRNTTSVQHVPVIKDIEMPHLFLYSPLNASDIIAQFEQSRAHYDDIHIGILRAYANPHNNTAIFEVVIEEPTIDQHTMLTLSPRDATNEYIVQMTTIGHARPTDGMHRAVEAVGDWITTLHIDSKIIAKKLRN